MILRITVSDNDFTQELEEFASDLDMYEYTRKLAAEGCSGDILYDYIKSEERFRELFYQTEKYTPELANELCEHIKKNWELWVNNVMKDHEWWSDHSITHDLTRSKIVCNCGCRHFPAPIPKYRAHHLLCFCKDHCTITFTGICPHLDIDSAVYATDLCSFKIISISLIRMPQI